jgi:alpha-ribazole phosphatase
MTLPARSAVADVADDTTVHVWRHPRARGADGCCIGRTDLAVDRRKAKRLAHRILAFARLHRLPHVVVTSPLRRCADIGRVLAAWGWKHRIDPLLVEVDFGLWDGRAWSEIPQADIDQWCDDLLNHRPGGGESVDQLLLRVGRWRPDDARLAVGHGGWLSAALWLGKQVPAAAGTAIAPCDWPAAPALGSRLVMRLTASRITANRDVAAG